MAKNHSHTHQKRKTNPISDEYFLQCFLYTPVKTARTAITLKVITKFNRTLQRNPALIAHILE